MMISLFVNAKMDFNMGEQIPIDLRKHLKIIDLNFFSDFFRMKIFECGELVSGKYLYLDVDPCKAFYNREGKAITALRDISESLNVWG